MEIDLHGNDPGDLGLTRWGEVEDGSPFQKMIREEWEMGTHELTFIHGHGHNRGISVGFVHTNTGFLGLCVRACLRKNKNLRQWIKRSTLNCKDRGVTAIALKPNPNPRPRQAAANNENEE